MSKHFVFALIVLAMLSLPLAAQTGTYGDVILEGDACCTTAGVLLRAKTAKPSVIAKSATADGTSGFLVFNSSNAELFRVQGNGVLALAGVAASPWHSWTKSTIEATDTSISFGLDTDLNFTSNGYWDGAWKYRTTDLAANLLISKGVHTWRVAPSGTAGAALTWTEAMRVTNTGDLGIGTASPLARLHVNGNSSAGTALQVTTPNSNGASIRFRDTVPSSSVGNGVLMEMQGNSIIQVSDLQIGYLNEPGIGTLSATLPLFLNRHVDKNVVVGSPIHATSGLRVESTGWSSFAGSVLVGGTPPRSTIAMDVTDSNPILLLKTADANGYYPAMRFQDHLGNTIGTVYGSKNTGLVLTSGAGGDGQIFLSGGKVGIGAVPVAKKLEVAGDAHFNGAVTANVITAHYQDVAEWVPASGEVGAGTVVVLNPQINNHVLPSSRPYDTSVAGVVSAQPGLVLGEASDSKVMVATTGRVRVRVDATKHSIAIGDLLVTGEKPGTAMKSIPLDVQGVAIHRPGTVVGKALEPLANGEGEILVLLSLQ